jgi:hypothetical protein
LLIGSIDPTNDPIVDEVRARAIIFLIVKVTQPVADLVILLLRGRGLLPLVAHLLRAFGS